MKAFQINPVFKKWALTGCLTAALGFSVSHNKHFDGFASVDMASSSSDIVEGKLLTAKGARPVKFLANGDKKITAIVSRLDTQGKVCLNCEAEMVTLLASFEENKDNIENLNILLLQEIDKKAAPAVAIAAKKPYVADPDLDAAKTEENFTDKKLSAIEDKCERKDEKADIIECKADSLVSLMNAYKDKMDPANKKRTLLEASKVQSWAKRNIIVGLSEEIRESRRMAVMLRKGTDLRPEDMDKDPEEIRTKSLAVIQTMLEGTPSRFEGVRKMVSSAELALTNTEAIEAQKAIREAKTPVQYNEAALQLQTFNGLMTSLNAANKAALDNAVALGDPSTALTQYYKNFNEYANKLSLAIAAGPGAFQNLNLQNMTIGDGTAISGSINGVKVTGVDANTKIIVINGANRQSDQFGPGKPGTLQPSTTSTVVFGPVESATAAQIRERTIRRAQ